MRACDTIVALLLTAGCAMAQSGDGGAAPTPLVDYHQHLISPSIARLWSQPGPVTSDRLVAQLDAAGIRRAIVLSVAYAFGSAWIERPADEYAAVRAENDWTAEQAARYPDRLIAVCSVNPLRDYALGEIDRCAGDPRLRTGLKLHFANSGVNLRDAGHVAQLRRVFAAANRHQMAIIAHVWTGDDRVANPYDARDARTFLSDILPMAPDVVVQIAHLGGSGPRLDPGTSAAMTLLAEAVAHGEPATKNVYFDIATNVMERSSEADAAFMASRMRQIGMKRLLYGSDGPPNPPAAEAWRVQCRKLGLTPAELQAIADNVAPYVPR